MCLDVNSVFFKRVNDVNSVERRVCMISANKKIREKIFINRLYHWQVANQLGISDATLSRWLRTPLSEDRKQRVEKAIDELLAERKEG